MLPSDDANQTKQVTQSTEAIERVPRSFDRRGLFSERRQEILQQKHTESLPKVNIDGASTRGTWKQVAQLREDNRRLRVELGEIHSELQRLLASYNSLQAEHEKEIVVIHQGHQQELDQYQMHLRELMDERNRIQEEHILLERRYQDLYASFQGAVEDEAQRMLTAATQTLELAPDQTPMVLQNMVKTIELQVRQEEDKHLVETLYLKREVQRMADQLDAVHRQLEVERQSLYAQQVSVREQADLRYKTLQGRLRARWRVASAATSIGLIFLLVILQFVFLGLGRVPLSSAIDFLLVSPILICIVLAVAFAGPFGIVGHYLTQMYHNIPHKKKAR